MANKHNLDKLLADLLDNWEHLSDRQRNEVTLSLGEAGPAGIEPILEALEKADAESPRHALLDAAASLGVHDERLRAHLVELLDPHPFLAAMLLADYDDPATLPDLLRTRDRLDTDPNANADDAIRELDRAIEAIEDVGRNDPCWCGSGRKYKRCHLANDNR